MAAILIVTGICAGAPRTSAAQSRLLDKDNVNGVQRLRSVDDAGGGDCSRRSGRRAEAEEPS
jgi:hypothetical protein